MADPLVPPPSEAFGRFAGVSAILAGLSGFAYTACFAALVRGHGGTAKPSAVLLMTTGLLAVPAAIGLFEKLRHTDAGFALLGLVLGLLGAAGSFLHGGYDLAVLLKPEGMVATGANQVDPRGLLTFGASALALFVYARLMVSAGFPTGLARTAPLLGTLLVVIYLGRLILLDPNKPLLKFAALLSGSVVGPIWYLWLGLCLRGRRPVPPPAGDGPAPAG